MLYTRYSNALNYVPGTRNRLSFVLARSDAGEDAATVARRIEAVTGLRARTSQQFAEDASITSSTIPAFRSISASPWRSA